MAGVEFDFSELNEFAVTLDEASPEIAKNVKKAVKTAAWKGRQEWMRAARRNAGKHLRAYPTSIDYDTVTVSADGAIETELGPNLARNQGPLGIVEDAPGGVRATPQRNYEKASKVIAEDLVKGVLIAVGDGLGE